jgi:hypothetical protein
MVEAAGVERFSVLTTRKLLIRGTARTAKKAHCPIHCTFIVRKYFRSGVEQTHRTTTVSHRFSEADRKSTRDTVSYPLSIFSLRRYAVSITSGFRQSGAIGIASRLPSKDITISCCGQRSGRERLRENVESVARLQGATGIGVSGGPAL